MCAVLPSSGRPLHRVLVLIPETACADNAIVAAHGGKGWKQLLKEALAEALDGVEDIFISLDTDMLDPAYAPGMGTPKPGGMTVRELFPMLRAVAANTNVVGVEMVELNPLGG